VWEQCAVLNMLRCFMRRAVAGNQDASLWTPSKVVDIFNATAGTWSVANLSEARVFLAAASLPNHGLAIFAGGIVLRSTSFDCNCSDRSELRGCFGWDGVNSCAGEVCRDKVRSGFSCFAQMTSKNTPTLWTFLTQPRELGELQISARLDGA
jgi:hypothetical protein